jgi:hypothetical protein
MILLARVEIMIFCRLDMLVWKHDVVSMNASNVCIERAKYD